MSAPGENPGVTLPKGLGRGGVLGLTGAVFQQLSMLVIITVLARQLGPGALGEYVLCYAVLALLGLVSVLGFRAALIRHVTGYISDANPGAVRGVIRLALFVCGGVSLAISAAVAAAAPTLGQMLGGGTLRVGLLIVAATIPAWTLRDVSLAATQGWRTQRAYTLITWVLEPLLRLVGTVVALLCGFGVLGALVAVLVAAWISAATGCWAMGRRLRSMPPGPATAVPWKPILAFAITSCVTGFSAIGLVWADTLLLGLLGSAEEVGTYTAATRLVGLAIFVMAPIDALFAPHFAHLYHNRDTKRLSAAYVAATTWTLRLSLPAFVLLMVFPNQLLKVFGGTFVAVGATVTIVLACGQLLNAATGPCGSLLVMSGANRLNLVDNVAALILNIALNIILIPDFGILGAGLAWALSIAIVNAVKMLQLRQLLGALPFDRTTAKTVAAGLSAGAIALVVRALPPTNNWELAPDVVAVYAGYIAVTLVLGLSAQELSTLQELRRSRSRQG